MIREQFSLAQTLTIVTGRLLCPMEEVYQIVSFMVGYPAFTHELPILCPPCQAEILRQHPGLAEVVLPEKIDASNLDEVVKSLEKAHGKVFEIEAFPEGTDFGDTHQLLAGKSVILVNAGGDGSAN